MAGNEEFAGQKNDLDQIREYLITQQKRVAEAATKDIPGYVTIEQLQKEKDQLLKRIKRLSEQDALKEGLATCDEQYDQRKYENPCEFVDVAYNEIDDIQELRKLNGNLKERYNALMKVYKAEVALNRERYKMFHMRSTLKEVCERKVMQQRGDLFEAEIMKARQESCRLYQMLVEEREKNLCRRMEAMDCIKKLKEEIEEMKRKEVATLATAQGPPTTPQLHPPAASRSSQIQQPVIPEVKPENMDKEKETKSNVVTQLRVGPGLRCNESVVHEINMCHYFKTIKPK